MISNYFYIQFKIINRKCEEFGLPPIIFYPLIIAIHLFVSNHFFIEYKTKTAFLYACFAATLMLRLCFNAQRNNFINVIFKKQTYLIIRVIENLIITSPFILFLFYKAFPKEALVLIFLNILFALINTELKINNIIHTPFSKNPFEFIVGFRKNILFIIGNYVLIFIGIYYKNINLSIFGMILLFLVIINFLVILENKYYIWFYNNTPKQFLKTKIKIIFKQIFILFLPVLAALFISFSQEIMMIIFFFLLGQMYVLSIVLIKYSSYPNQISFPDYILFGISFLFPPIHLLIIPYFYNKSIEKLKMILHDKN